VTPGSGTSPTRLDLRQRAARAVLLVYVLVSLVLPALHLAFELVEELRSDCQACASGHATEPDALAGWRVPCSPGAPCSDRRHSHHTHPFHDASHCTVCSTFNGVCASVAPSTGAVLETAHLQGEQTIAIERGTSSSILLCEFPRGPPRLPVAS
jgi:hypothetical protein